MTTATTARHLSVAANGLSHRVYEWSVEPSVRPRGTAVLVHGFMDAGGTWERVAPDLTRAGFRVLAPDMRGFGGGGRVSAGGYYHFVDYVFDLADLVDSLVPGDPIVLVGHSMGGTISTLYAGTFPERVKKLANLEGIGPPDHPWELGPIRMRAWIDGVRKLRGKSGAKPTFDAAEAVKRLATNHPNVPEDVLARCIPHLCEDAGNGRLAWHYDPLHRTTSPMPFFAKLFVEFAKKVTCPVLFVSGGPLGFHPPDEAERLAAFAHLERAELPDAGHMLHWSQPEKLAPLLVRFFGE